MAVSDINISALTASGGVNSNTLLAVWNDALAGSCTLALQPAKFRWYASKANSKPSTPIAADTVLPLFTHTGLAASETWFYWVAAVDAANNEGVAFPVGGGRSATTSVAPASASDLAAAQVEYRALVTTEKTERTTQDSSLASLVNDVTATATDAQTKAALATANARIEMRANVSGTAPASSIDIMASKTVGGTKTSAGARINLPASGPSTFDIIAAQFRLLNASGNPVFLVDSNGDLSANSIKSKTMFIGGVGVPTSLVADNAITAIETTPGTNIAVNLSTTTNLGNIVSDTIVVPTGQTEQWTFFFHCDQTKPGNVAANNGSYSFAIYDNGVVVPGSTPVYFYDDNFVSNPLIMTAKDVGAGSHIINVQCNVSPDGGLAQFNLQNLFLTILRCKR